jgi:hypothetical protein
MAGRGGAGTQREGEKTYNPMVQLLELQLHCRVSGWETPMPSTKKDHMPRWYCVVFIMRR